MIVWAIIEPDPYYLYRNPTRVIEIPTHVDVWELGLNFLSRVLNAGNKCALCCAAMRTSNAVGVWNFGDKAMS